MFQFQEGRPGTENRGTLRIAAARLEDAGRTMVLTTDPHPRAATYRLDLEIEPGAASVPVAYDLSGVEVTWTDGGTTSWKGCKLRSTLDPATGSR